MVGAPNICVVIGLNLTFCSLTVMIGATSAPFGSPAKPSPDHEYTTLTLAAVMPPLIEFIQPTNRWNAAWLAVVGKLQVAAQTQVVVVPLLVQLIPGKLVCDTTVPCSIPPEVAKL